MQYGNKIIYKSQNKKDYRTGGFLNIDKSILLRGHAKGLILISK